MRREERGGSRAYGDDVGAHADPPSYAHIGNSALVWKPTWLHGMFGLIDRDDAWKVVGWGLEQSHGKCLVAFVEDL